jgi:hypothetical protein
MASCSSCAKSRRSPFQKAHLVRQSSALELRLSYFTYLEQAQRMLHNPGEDLVLSEGFLGMVETLDRCLTYLRDHVSRTGHVFVGER